PDRLVGGSRLGHPESQGGDEGEDVENPPPHPRVDGAARQRALEDEEEGGDHEQRRGLNPDAPAPQRQFHRRFASISQGAWRGWPRTSMAEKAATSPTKRASTGTSPRAGRSEENARKRATTPISPRSPSRVRA